MSTAQHVWVKMMTVIDYSISQLNIHFSLANRSNNYEFSPMDEHGSWFPLCKCIQCPLPGFMFSFHDINFSVYMVQTKLSTPGSWACSTHSKMAAIDAAPTCWWNSTKNTCPIIRPAVMKLENWSAYSTSHSFTMYSVHPFVPFDSAYLIHPSTHWFIHPWFDPRIWLKPQRYRSELREWNVKTSFNGRPGIRIGEGCQWDLSF